MPWRTGTVMDARARFVFEARSNHLTFAALCRRYGISRPTGYEWIERHREGGIEDLADHSHRPRSSPHATPLEVESRIVELRKRRGWGAPKLQELLQNERGRAPAISTIHRILVRNSLVEKRKPRRTREEPAAIPFEADEPNDLWTADFKGQFRMKDSQLCYPLTIQEARSRFLLECRGLASPTLEATKHYFRNVFQVFGLPWRIRTDNGPPFASFNSLARLSALSAWWLELGIHHELIQPGKPQQNPRHERMHKDLKREATRPPRAHLQAQQRAFNTFRRTFNEERPHQALGQKCPATIYVASSRPFPARPKPLEYPPHFEVRKVSQLGRIRWNERFVWVSRILIRKYVGLEEVGDGVWAVYFGTRHLGWFDEADYLIMDVMGKRRGR